MSNTLNRWWQTANKILTSRRLSYAYITGGALWLAWLERKSSPSRKTPVLALSLVLPLAFSPYVQLYDLLLVVPIFIVWAGHDNSSRFFNSAVFTYAGTFILTFFAAFTGIAWLLLISMIMAFQIIMSNNALIRLT